jgi:hypothetical protein
VTRTIHARLLTVTAVLAGLLLGVGPIGGPSPVARALDSTPWVLPTAPPRCTVRQAESGNVAGCLLAFYEDPAATGWGQAPAPGVGEGWTWSGYWYNGSPALAGWESTYIAGNSQPLGGLRTGTLRTHAAAQALFEGFLAEIVANGYRVGDASGYSFRCTSANGGWSCPSGDPDDLSNHAWGLAVDMNAGANPIRTYSSVNGVTACMTPIQTDLPRWVIQTAEKWGLYWGGYGWNSGCSTTDTQRTIVTRDPPHFEFRGTPRQAAAIAAYNLANDPLAVCTTVIDDAGQPAERCNRTGRPEAGWRLAVQLQPPAGATAAVINLTATDAAAPGYLTLEDCAPRTGMRATSAINYEANQAVATMAVVPLDAAGRFCVYRSSAVHSIVDVTAYLGSDGAPLWFEPSTPRRLTDTRLAGACAPNAACVPGTPPQGTLHGVPTDDGSARILNLTSVDAGNPGWLQVGRCSDVGPAGTFSNLNVSPGNARANLALVPAGDTGVCAFTQAGGEVIVDELGHLSDDRTAGFGWKLSPARRVIDTRQCHPAWCAGRPGAGAVVHVDLGTTAPGAAVSVVATDTSGAGYLTVGSCADLDGNVPPPTSNVNYGSGATVAGLVLSALHDGELCVYTHAGAHIVVDVQAELTGDHRIGLLPVTPTRVHDSRRH